MVGGSFQCSDGRTWDTPSPLKEVLLSSPAFLALQHHEVKTRRFTEDVRRLKLLSADFSFPPIIRQMLTDVNHIGTI